MHMSAMTPSLAVLAALCMTLLVPSTSAGVLYLKAIRTLPLTLTGGNGAPQAAICLAILQVTVADDGKVTMQSMVESEYSFWTSWACYSPDYLETGYQSASCKPYFDERLSGTLGWEFEVQGFNATKLSGTFSVDNSVTWCGNDYSSYADHVEKLTGSFTIMKVKDRNELLGVFGDPLYTQVTFSVLGGKLLGVTPPAQCPAGMEPSTGAGALAGCKICNKGYASAGTVVCKACTGSTYSPHVGFSTCVKCADKSVPRPEYCWDTTSACTGPNTKCVGCPSGQVAKSGDTKCVACPSNSFGYAAGTCFRCTPEGTHCCTRNGPASCKRCAASTKKFNVSARLVLTAAVATDASSKCSTARATHCMWGLDFTLDQTCRRTVNFWRPSPVANRLSNLYLSPVDGQQVSCRLNTQATTAADVTSGLSSNGYVLSELLDAKQYYATYCKTYPWGVRIDWRFPEYQLGVTLAPSLVVAADGKKLELVTKQPGLNCKFTYQLLSGRWLGATPSSSCARPNPLTWQCVPGLKQPLHLGVFRWWKADVQAASADGKAVLTNSSTNCAQKATIFNRAATPPPKLVTCTAAQYSSATHWCSAARKYLKQFFAKGAWQCADGMPTGTQGYLVRVMGNVVQCAAEKRGQACYVHPGGDCWAALRALTNGKISLASSVSCTAANLANPKHWCWAAKKYIGGVGSKCGACTPGRYAAKTAANGMACALCPPGTYADSPGATACTACPAGRSAWGVGNSGCTACSKAPDPNFWRNTTGTASCKGCENYCVWDTCGYSADGWAPGDNCVSGLPEQNCSPTQ